jgi:natural product precursor
MKNLMSNFSDSLLSKEQMKAVKGGVDHYWACNDNADSIAYMTADAAYNHCMSSLACTSCKQFNIP